MVKVFEVIWIHDDCIRPPGPKMVVCVEPELGYFFRINTEPKWQNPVLIKRNDNDWLEHDSYLECGQPLVLDDYIVDLSLKGRGVIGRLNFSLVNVILTAMSKDDRVTEEDFDSIKKVLRRLIDVSASTPSSPG